MSHTTCGSEPFTNQECFFGKLLFRRLSDNEDAACFFTLSNDRVEAKAKKTAAGLDLDRRLITWQLQLYPKPDVNL
jgi:hypothetical protein